MISLDIEWNRIENHRFRLKRKRDHLMADQITRSVCLNKYEPDTIVVSPEFSHLVCQSSLDNIFD